MASSRPRLGINVDAGGAIADTDGVMQRYVVHITDFGCPRGTICTLMSSAARATIVRAAAASGYYSSLSESYARYDRDLFSGTLDDWGGSAAASLRPGTRPGVGRLI